MSKRVKVIASVVAVMFVLSTVGITATVMAQGEEAPTDGAQAGVSQEELNEALNTALNNAVAQGLITEQQADNILERWERMEQIKDRWEDAKGKLRLGLMFKQLLGMDEAEVDEYLANLVEEEKITEEQAEQIKDRWEDARGKIRLGLMFKQLLGMDEEEVDEYLANLVEEEKITEEQAEQIKDRWEQAKERIGERTFSRSRIFRAQRGTQRITVPNGWRCLKQHQLGD